MDLPSHMVLFARVVEAGSFSAAARELNQSPSAVSKQMAHLEDSIGLRLLNRSKTGITLTEEGRLFAEHCESVARTVEAAREMASEMGDHPKGRLSVGSTVAFGKAQLLPLVPSFMDVYPEVTIAMDFSDRPFDFGDDHLDVAIRFTEQLTDDTVVARKLAHNRRVFVASPEYIAQHGAPTSPADLADHNCLRLSSVERWNDWNLGSEGGPEDVADASRFEANSADAVYHAALAGIGVTRLSTYLIADDLEMGRLVRVLPDHEDNSSDIFAVYSARRNLPPKVRAFIDHLVEAFTPVPPWERKTEFARIAAE